MTLTTEELQWLVDEATADAAFNASLADMSESLGGSPDQFRDMEGDCNRIAYLARRVIAAEKMAEALTNAVTDSNENGREMVCYWVDDAKDAITEYESTK